MATEGTEVPKSDEDNSVKPMEQDQQKQEGNEKKQEVGAEGAVAKGQEHVNNAEGGPSAKKDEAEEDKVAAGDKEEAAKENGTQKESAAEEKVAAGEPEAKEKLEQEAGEKDEAKDEKGGPVASKEETDNMVEDKPETEQTETKEPPTEVVKQVVKLYGGRHSKAMGLDVDSGNDDDIEQWFLVALLFSRGISTEQTLRTFDLLREEGVKTVKDAGQIDYQKLWDKLTEAKAQRTDKTAAMLQQIWTKLESEYEGKVATLKKVEDPKELTNVLKKFHGVGPTTAELFLRDLRGVWPAANGIPLNDRAISAGQHLGLCGKPSRKRGRGGQKSKGANSSGEEGALLGEFEQLAKDAGTDLRDLETGLIKFHNAHYRSYGKCQKAGAACTALSAENAAAAAAPEAPTEG